MEKKKTNWFKLAFLGLFLAYMALYILNMSGYYEGGARRKIEFTNEQIQKFEADIASGEEVDIKEYLKDIEKDYTNSASHLGYMISKNVDALLNRGIKIFLNMLGKVLT